MRMIKIRGHSKKISNNVSTKRENSLEIKINEKH